jgi:hypothetical protein
MVFVTVALILVTCIACITHLALAPALAPPAFAAGPQVGGDPDSPPPQPRIEPLADGTMRMVFVERSPFSEFETLRKRFNWSAKMERPADYVLEEESFIVYMPPDYNPAQPTHGLLVWISPTETGTLPPVWMPVMDEQKLVWIGADQSGNYRPSQWHRLGLALDALHNMMTHFAIDEERVYVSGFSGGGRAASLLAPHFADVIRGGLYMCGSHYFRNVPVPGRPGEHFEEQMSRPAPELYDLAHERSRFVLLTGEKDYNRDETYSIYRNGYRRDSFRHVTYIEIPEMPHAMPLADWLTQAIEALDEPLKGSG